MQDASREYNEKAYVFILDKIDPDCGKFIIVKSAPFETKEYKDILVYLKTQKVIIKV